MKSNILIKPLITEKTMANAAKGVYTFGVDVKANKNEIKKSVEKLFNVKVLSVKTIIVKGKIKVNGRKRIKVKDQSVKKAIVSINPDQKIDLFEVSQS